MGAENIQSRVREALRTLLEVEYTKELPITIDGNHYICTLYLNQQDRPLVLEGEFTTEELFIQFLIKELISRRLHTVEYFLLVKELDHLDELETL